MFTRFKSMIGFWIMLVLVANPGYSDSEVQRHDAPPTAGLVVAIDVSGSMRPVFQDILKLVDGLVAVLPEESRLALIRFDESAEEFARTHDLTEMQRHTVRDRLHKLRAIGQWTNYGPAVEQIRASATAMGTPLLVVVITDNLSDPGQGQAFSEMDVLLRAAFAEQDAVSVLLLTPNNKVPAPVTSRGLVCTESLSQVSPEEILAHVPSNPAREEGPQTSGTAGSELKDATTPVPDPPIGKSAATSVTAGEGDSKPSQFLNADAPSKLPVRSNAETQSFPWALPALGLLAVAAMAAVVVFIVWDAEQARWLRRTRRKKSASTPRFFDLIARCNAITFNLGNCQEVDRVRIGTTPGCQVLLRAAGQGEEELLLVRRDNRFHLHNVRGGIVQLNGAKLPPGTVRRVRLPARIALERHPAVSLSLRPRAVPSQPESETTNPSKETCHGNGDECK